AIAPYATRCEETPTVAELAHQSTMNRTTMSQGEGAGNLRSEGTGASDAADRRLAASAGSLRPCGAAPASPGGRGEKSRIDAPISTTHDRAYIHSASRHPLISDQARSSGGMHNPPTPCPHRAMATAMALWRTNHWDTAAASVLRNAPCPRPPTNTP